MRRIKKKRTNKFSSLLKFGLGSIEAIGKGILWAIGELLAEIVVFGIGLGIAVIFHSLGASNDLAWVLSIFVLIFILILTIKFSSHRKRKRNVFPQVRGEEKLAHWISQTLAQKAPQEWEEYQDWLHDILLARFQLLDRGCPVWKVRIITYWRLIGFCFILCLNKLRRLANVGKKLR